LNQKIGTRNVGEWKNFVVNGKVLFMAEKNLYVWIKTAGIDYFCQSGN
jgi:hypothetical protein